MQLYTIQIYEISLENGKESNLSVSLHNPSEVPCIYLIMGYHITQSGAVTLTKEQILLHLHWATLADDKLKAAFSKYY